MVAGQKPETTESSKSCQNNWVSNAIWKLFGLGRGGSFWAGFGEVNSIDGAVAPRFRVGLGLVQGSGLL